MTTTPTPAPEVEALTRPIVDIENRTPQEVFDIMADRYSIILLSQAARIKELEAERDALERVKDTVASETFAYYVAGAHDGWCKIPLRVAEDMALAHTAISSERDRLASHVKRLRGAVEPFARIAFYVEYTDKRDGNVVHRQRVIKEGKPASWMALTKDDFRTARAAYEETQDGE